MVDYLTIKLILNTNNVSYIEATDPKYGYEPIESTGTFTIDKVSSGYKYITCLFTNNKICKLKFSIKKRNG